MLKGPRLSLHPCQQHSKLAGWPLLLPLPAVDPCRATNYLLVQARQALGDGLLQVRDAHGAREHMAGSVGQHGQRPVVPLP